MSAVKGGKTHLKCTAEQSSAPLSCPRCPEMSGGYECWRDPSSSWEREWAFLLVLIAKVTRHVFLRWCARGTLCLTLSSLLPHLWEWFKGSWFLKPDCPQGQGLPRVEKRLFCFQGHHKPCPSSKRGACWARAGLGGDHVFSFFLLQEARLGGAGCNANCCLYQGGREQWEEER